MYENASKIGLMLRVENNLNKSSLSYVLLSTAGGDFVTKARSGRNCMLLFTFLLVAWKFYFIILQWTEETEFI